MAFDFLKIAETNIQYTMLNVLNFDNNSNNNNKVKHKIKHNTHTTLITTSNNASIGAKILSFSISTDRCIYTRM